MTLSRTRARRVLAVFLCVASAEMSALAIVKASQGSASASSGQIADAGALEKRAQAYWERRQAKDLSGAYPFYCASYRSRVSQADFLQMTRLVRFTLRDVKVSQMVAVGARAEITVDYRFMIPTLPNPENSGQTKEMWARDPDGQWCKEDEPLVLPFPDSFVNQSPPPPGA